MSDMILKVPYKANRSIKKVGRGPGSGLGKTSGKGHKGQNARSGGGVRPGFEGGQLPLFRRIARRGFSNYPFKYSFAVVNVAELDAKFNDGDVVSWEALVEKRIIKASDVLVKILGDGDLTKKLTIELLDMSASAKEKIEKAGGTIIQEEIGS
ncbi:MAG: 50S ribosomal protein L15 [Spirochaetia bacterium]|nr:50S ribosomal protein L15 [Spirochaetia bacterium]